MAKQIEQDEIKRRSLVWFCHRSVAVLVSVLFLSEPVAALGATGVRMAQQPAATEQDGDRAAAKRAFAEGQQLRKQGTAESLRQAIEKYEEALRLWQVVGNRSGVASTLHSIGFVYQGIGQPQKALEFYNRALPIFKEMGDRSGVASTLNNIGGVYNAIGQPQKALEFFTQALPIRKEVGDRSMEAITLSNIGRVYQDIGQPQKALEFFTQALPIRKEVGDRSGVATTLNNIGRVYQDIGQRLLALEFYTQALPILKQVRDRSMEAITLSNIGRVYQDIGQPQKALEFYTQALPIFKQVGNRSGEAVTLNNIGVVYQATGQPQKALEFYTQALPIRKEVGDRSGVASTLNNIGLVYQGIGQPQKALEFFTQVLPISKEVGDRSGVATTLNSIGVVYQATGQPQKALEFFTQALPIRKEVGDRSMEAITLHNIGGVYQDIGQPQKALEFYNSSLSISREVGDRSGVASTLNNIGLVYQGIGQPQKALEFFTQALPIRKEVGDRSGEAVTLHNIGFVYQGIGQPQKALEFYNQALPIRKEVGDRSGVAGTLNNIGFVYQDIGQRQKALEFYTQALAIRKEVGDRSGVAGTLNNIGGVYNAIGQPQKALEFFNSSLPIFKQVGNRSSEAVTLKNIAVVERDKGNLAEACTQIEAAIKIIEDIRTNLVSQELRTSYFASVQSYYEFYIDLLMQLHKQRPSAGYDALALQASERARARTLLEILTEANADIRQGVEPKLLEKERTLVSQLDVLEKRRIQLLSGEHTDAQAVAIDKQIEALLEQYRQVQAQIRATSPRYAALTQPQPLTLAEIQQQVLDSDTLLLEYSLGKERSYLWAVTKTGITSYELPARADIEAAAKSFRDALIIPMLRTRPKQVASSAVPLSQMLLGPVAKQLGQKRLLIVGDGALQYVPFEALPVPTPAQMGSKASPPSSTTPLLVEHEIVSLPSASTLAILRRELKGRKPAAKTVAIIADPVFGSDDERVQKTVASAGKPTSDARATRSDKPLEQQALERSAQESDVTFARLPGTRQEAEQILQLVPASSRIQAFDFAANRDQATSPNLAQYRIVHFATHGILNSVNPELSGLVLSLVDEKGALQNGFLRLHDIFNLKLPAELVVLSACQTGLGEEVRGEGLVGLTRGFMYAGTPRVVVSLWSVDDEATALLMRKFYSGMLEKGLQPAAALRAAQLEMWKHQQWQSPYYWAAFVLQGEWR